MNKLLLLVSCVLAAASAGRIVQRGWQRDIGIADQRIQRMSWQDLQRQKFLLDVVQRVQQPLMQDELIQLDQGLIMDPPRYRGGIDDEMQRVIDLDRQRRLLDEHQNCSLQNVEHVQQLRGIYRLLVRAIDFETLQRNVVYLRRNINPVLLINALTMAIRDREDTQNLIMPAMQELLPELYLDQEVIERVQRMHLEMEQTQRPTLTDIMGLRQRLQQMNPIMRMVMPWRDIHMQMALSRQSRVVVPLRTEEEDISLLTEDIGMRNFIRNLIQELSLQEDIRNNRQTMWLEDERPMDMDRDMKIEQRHRDAIDIDRELLNRRLMEQDQNADEGIDALHRDDDNEDESGINMSQIRVPILRGIGEGIERMSSGWRNRQITDNLNQLPTVDSRSDRLLHVGRRRQNVEPEIEQQMRFMGVVRGDRLSEGRRVTEKQTESRRNVGREIRRNEDDDTQLLLDNLPTVRRDDERLLHVNRRRLSETMDDMSPRRINRIGEGRRISDADQSIIDTIRRDSRVGQLTEGEILEMDRERQMDDQWREDQIRTTLRNINEDEDEDEDIQRATDNLRTVRRDDERLLHVNRRRLGETMDSMSPRRINRVGEGRRISDADQSIIDAIRRDSRVGQLTDEDKIRSTIRNINEDEDMQRSTDNLRTVRRDDERLLHINRRRLNQPAEMIPRRVSSIGEGRRVNDVNGMSVDDMKRLISVGNVRPLSTDEINDAWHRQIERKERPIDNVLVTNHRSRRSLVNLVEEDTSRRSDIVLHTLRQLVARVNQERIAMRLADDELQLSGNSRVILPNIEQAQRYALRLNEMRLESRRNRDVLDQINDIERRLQQVIPETGNRRNAVSDGDQIDEQLRMERVIGDILMGRLGDVGVLRIVREMLEDDVNVSLRNPVLLHTLRRILNVVDELQTQQLGAYRRDQLDLQDVTINDVRVSKLRTRVEDSDMDVSNLLEQPQQWQMLVRQRRLSNKPFTIDMDITSQRAQDVVIRIFLGPRQDTAGRELSLEERRMNFVLLDAVNTQLQTGRNRIQQRSTNISWTTQDATPCTEIYRSVMSAVRSQQGEDMLTELVGENGRFPQRLLLPRGRPEGLPMQLLVIVTPIEREERQEAQMRMDRLGGVMGITQASLEDRRPLGYPLDRRIENEEQLLQLPNVQMQDVVIVHEN